MEAVETRKEVVLKWQTSLYDVANALKKDVSYSVSRNEDGSVVTITHTLDDGEGTTYVHRFTRVNGVET